jgi:hypothetical protein
VSYFLVFVSAPGYERVITHLFCAGDPYLLEDAVFAVLDSLILEWPELNDEEERKKFGFEKSPYTKIHYDFKLAPTVTKEGEAAPCNNHPHPSAAEETSVPASLPAGSALSALSTPIDKIYRFTRANDGIVCYGTTPTDSIDDSMPTRLEILSGDPVNTPLQLMRRTGTSCDVGEIMMPVDPPNVHCVGLNYMKHFEEGAKKRGVAEPVEPTMFMKPTTSLCGPLADIERPMNLTTESGDEAAWMNLDFEGEVGIPKCLKTEQSSA